MILLARESFDDTHFQLVFAIYAIRDGQMVCNNRPTFLSLFQKDHKVQIYFLQRWPLRNYILNHKETTNALILKQECIPVGCVPSAAVAVC